MQKKNRERLQQPKLRPLTSAENVPDTVYSRILRYADYLGGKDYARALSVCSLFYAAGHFSPGRCRVELQEFPGSIIHAGEYLFRHDRGQDQLSINYPNESEARDIIDIPPGINQFLVLSNGYVIASHENTILCWKKVNHKLAVCPDILLLDDVLGVSCWLRHLEGDKFYVLTRTTLYLYDMANSPHPRIVNMLGMVVGRTVITAENYPTQTLYVNPFTILFWDGAQRSFFFDFKKMEAIAIEDSISDAYCRYFDSHPSGKVAVTIQYDTALYLD